ncbi:hypothetical protein STENM327S_08670 [Streptomyces tendae]
MRAACVRDALGRACGSAGLSSASELGGRARRGRSGDACRRRSGRAARTAPVGGMDNAIVAGRPHRGWRRLAPTTTRPPRRWPSAVARGAAGAAAGRRTAGLGPAREPCCSRLALRRCALRLTGSPLGARSRSVGLTGLAAGGIRALGHLVRLGTGRYDAAVALPLGPAGCRARGPRRALACTRSGCGATRHPGVPPAASDGRVYPQREAAGRRPPRCVAGAERVLAVAAACAWVLALPALAPRRPRPAAARGDRSGPDALGVPRSRPSYDHYLLVALPLLLAGLPYTGSVARGAWFWIALVPQAPGLTWPLAGG